MIDLESEIKHTDFNKAFEELYVHQLSIPGINIRNTFEVREIGELILTSGQLFAWDWNPFMTLEDLKDWRLRWLCKFRKCSLDVLLETVLNLSVKIGKDEQLCC